MDGFGASITDGAAWLLHERLTPKARHKAMTQLFSPTQGIGLSFLRQPIAASDLSRNEYSFDDLPPDRTGETDRGDPALQRFSVSHDTGYVFPVIREALKLNPSITVMATPKWTAMQQ